MKNIFLQSFFQPGFFEADKKIKAKEDKEHGLRPGGAKVIYLFKEKERMATPGKVVVMFT